MRLRKVSGAKATLELSNYVISLEELCDIKHIYQKNQPLYMEVGMGKGNFIINMAKKYPAINFLGVEKFDSVLVRAVEKLEEEEISNLKLICADIIKFSEYMEEGIVEKIFLNFSDPWPKSRHRGRRLTSDKNLKCMWTMLKSGGMVIQKTDNLKLFEYSILSALRGRFIVKNKCYDLHASSLSENNIMTEYEEKFSNQGNKINYAQYVKEE